MDAGSRLKTWYPGTQHASWAPECQYDVHQYCTGNADLSVHGVVYERVRCGCPCHHRKVRRVDWPAHS
ncbi:hypothetical protein KGG77_gp31 [Streptomyces phage Omar]|uniref:Uncharacterized protein n=1 Tax=Streptomyces phage Omar TaxID=2059882 RepID=A0A2H5BLQ2_9CAUD|nr:hypothetical protein KGG77_gp31 [Streptomyces phage Omar]AUG87237.1 hypothetical protein SEA_OMAR_53 [Streptomyces phage Omar]